MKAETPAFHPLLFVDVCGYTHGCGWLRKSEEGSDSLDLKVWAVMSCPKVATGN